MAIASGDVPMGLNTGTRTPQKRIHHPLKSPRFVFMTKVWQGETDKRQIYITVRPPAHSCSILNVAIHVLHGVRVVLMQHMQHSDSLNSLSFSEHAAHVVSQIDRYTKQPKYRRDLVWLDCRNLLQQTRARFIFGMFTTLWFYWFNYDDICFRHTAGDTRVAYNCSQ